MAEMFVFLRSDAVVFYGSEIATARELAGLSQKGLAAALIRHGLEHIGDKAVSQVEICRMENKGAGFVTKAEALAFKIVLGIEGD